MAQGPAEKGQKELKTDWPVEEGLTAETQKQTGRSSKLLFTEGSNVLSRTKELL